MRPHLTLGNVESNRSSRGFSSSGRLVFEFLTIKTGSVGFTAVNRQGK